MKINKNKLALKDLRKANELFKIEDKSELNTS